MTSSSRRRASSSRARPRTPPSGRRPESQFFQSWFDFYPLYIAESGGKATMEDGKAQFADEAGQKVAAFWRTMYEEGCRRTRSTTATPSASRRPRWRSWARGRSPSTARTSTGASCRSRPRPASRRRDPDLQRREVDGHVLGVQEPRHGLGVAEVRDQPGAGRRAARGDRPDADAHRPRDDLPGLLRRRTPTTSSSPSRPPAPSRCRTCRTRSRSGRRSATPTRSR